MTVFCAQVTGTATLNFDRKLISRSTVSYSISIGRTQDILSVQVDPALRALTLIAESCCVGCAAVNASLGVLVTCRAPGWRGTGPAAHGDVLAVSGVL